MAFKKGQLVTWCLSGAGVVTKEPGFKVLKVTKKGVYLDRGPGNDPSGPFDPNTGNYLEAGIPGFRAWIVAKELNEAVS